MILRRPLMTVALFVSGVAGEIAYFGDCAVIENALL
jgi:hypothetical protein